MKTIDNFICERLTLNKQSKICEIIPRKFVHKTTYTRTEVDIIEKYAKQLVDDGIISQDQFDAILKKMTES